MKSYNDLNKGMWLLPTYFKWIGLVMMIFVLFFLGIIKYTNSGLFKTQPDFIKLICSNFFIVGLFLIAVAKDKVEDELTLIIRLRAMGIAFGTTIFYIIINPFFDLIWKEPIKELKGNVIIMGMLFMYLICFFFLKKRR